MKANNAPKNNKRKAPDKIYACFGVFGLIQAKEIRATSKDIEYTRTDAFIEKACAWLKENCKDYIIVDIDNKYEGVDGLFLEDFRNYMEGE